MEINSDPATTANSTESPALPLLRLAVLTATAIAIHGYHLGSDDAAIYLPAVKKFVRPDLYPFGSEFFLVHARLSQFAAVVGSSALLSHLDVGSVTFCWYVAMTFVYLLAAWKLAVACFHSSHARWSAMMTMATTLTVPAAGTALVLMDPYLTARSASTPLTMLAVASFLGGRQRLAILWVVLATLAHPLMGLIGAVCLGLLALPPRWTESLFHLSFRRTAPAAFLGFDIDASTPAYREALAPRGFLFLWQWTWYEWIGLGAPVAFLFCCGRSAPRGTSEVFGRVSRAAVLLGLSATVVGAVLSSSPHLEGLVRLQPMRAFQLIYILFFLLLGGLLGDYVLQSRYWAWIVLYAGIGAGMCLLQFDAYPQSAHIEWPWVAPENPWLTAFLWVKDNTPANAVFALDPEYALLPREDLHGFRALAERSVLSDRVKDAGVVSLFPQIAPEWEQQQRAQAGWKAFQLKDFQRLAAEYPVSWVVLEGAAIDGLECPYANAAVTVCRIPGAIGLPSHP